MRMTRSVTHLLCHWTSDLGHLCSAMHLWLLIQLTVHLADALALAPFTFWQTHAARTVILIRVRGSRIPEGLLTHEAPPRVSPFEVVRTPKGAYGSRGPCL